MQGGHDIRALSAPCGCCYNPPVSDASESSVVSGSGTLVAVINSSMYTRRSQWLPAEPPPPSFSTSAPAKELQLKCRRTA